MKKTEFKETKHPEKKDDPIEVEIEPTENEEDIETLEEETIVDETCNKETDIQKEEIASLKNQLIRLQADFANYRQRMQKKELESVNIGVEKLAEKIFPVYDTFLIALSQIEDASVKQGVLMIKDKLLEALREENIEPFNSDGEEFDPNRHHAILAEEKDGVEENTIIETFKEGFKRKDKILRPAMVKVSK